MGRRKGWRGRRRGDGWEARAASSGGDDDEFAAGGLMVVYASGDVLGTVGY